VAAPTPRQTRFTPKKQGFFSGLPKPPALVHDAVEGFCHVNPSSYLLIRDPLGGDVPRHAEHVGDEPEKLAAGELVVEAGFVGHVADVQVGTAGVLDEVEAAHAHAASRGLQEPHEHLDRGGLAGAVGPEQGEQFAAWDGQRKIRDGRLRAVGAGDVVELDHGMVGGSSG